MFLSDLVHSVTNIVSIDLLTVIHKRALSRIKSEEMDILGQSLRQATKLPQMSNLKSLKRLTLDTMKGIRDLRPLLDSPALTDLVVQTDSHMQPGDFACLKNHPTLRRLSAGLGSHKKNAEVERLIPLPQADWPMKVPMK